MRRQLQGTVTSTAMDKTITVKVDRIVVHPKYQKRYTVSKKYLVHDEKGEAKRGDVVTFKEIRPMSKRKRWMLVSIKKSEA